MNHVKNYYQNQFFITFHSFKRQYPLGVLFILIQIGWLYYFLISKENLQYFYEQGFLSLDSVTNLIDVDDAYKQKYSLTAFIICFTINLSIIMLSLIDCLYYSFKSSNNYQNIQIVYTGDSISVLQNLLSIILKSYTYIIYTPAVLFSLFYSGWLGILNVVLSILLGIFIDFHDFDYSLNSKDTSDSLSKYPLNFLQFVKKTLLTILIVNRAQFNYDISQYICLISSLIGVFYLTFFRQYHKKAQRQLQYILMMTLGVASVVCFMIRTNVSMSFHFLLLAIVPVIIKVALDVQERVSSVESEYLTLKQNVSGKNTLKQIFYIQDMMGQLDSFNYIKYYSNPNSIILESISSEHTEQCSQRHCFCQEIVKGDKEKKQEKRRDHLILHIDSLFREILRTVTGLTSLHFYYINFLVEQANSKARTLFQIQRLKHEFPKTSIIFRVYFHYLTHKIKKSFKLENTNTLGEIVGLVFEEHLRITSQVYESSLYQKLEFLSFLNNDHINVLEVQKCCTELYSSRTFLKNKINFLTSLHPHNEQLNIIRNGFNMNFCFVLSHDSIHIPTYTSPIQNNINKAGTAIASTYRHNIFENDTCVLFLSAELPTLGNILKGQRSFEEMFGIPNFIGKNINSILPNCMVQEHQHQMKQYLFNSEKKYSSITEIPLALAKNSDSFAVPVSVRATIDHVSAFDKIGFVCTIKLNYSLTNCLLISKDTFGLQLVSKQFFSSFLQKSYDLSEIGLLNASKIFPHIPIATMNEDSYVSEIKDALMILPSSSKSSLSHLDSLNSKEYFKSSSLSDKILRWSEQEILSNTNSFVYYHVQLEIHLTKNSEFPCFIVSVKNSQKVTNLFEISHLIQQLQAEYSKLNQQTSFCDIDTQTNLGGQSTRIGYSENFHFHDHTMFPLQQMKHSTSFRQQKSIMKVKTLYPDSLQNTKFEEILSAKNDQRDSPFLGLSVMKRSHASLIYDKNLSPQQTPHEVSRSIFQDMPSTYRHTDRENQSMLSKQHQEIELSKVLSPMSIEEEFFHKSERNEIKQLPDKFWKASPQKSAEQPTNKTKRLSKDIIKRLQAFSEKSDDNKFKKKPQQESTSHQNTLHSSTNQMEKAMSQSHHLSKSKLGSSLHTLTEEEQTNQKQGNIMLTSWDKGQIQISQLKVSQHEKLQQQVSFSPDVVKVGGHDGDHSSNSNQADNGQKVNQYQQSSLISSSGSTREALKQVERKIMTSQSSLGLRILNIFGLVSVLSITLTIILQGQQIQSAFNKASVDFNFVSWPMDIASSMSQIQLYVIEYYMVVLQLIPALTKRWTTASKDLLGNIKTMNVEWTALWMDQVRSDQSQTPYFYDTTIRKISWEENKDHKSYQGDIFPFYTSEYYFVQNYLNAYKTYMIMTTDAFNQQAILVDNYQAYFSQASTVKENILNTSVSSLESITTSASLLMLLCIVLSLSMILFIFPIYAYIQYSNEQIMKLMSTLNAHSIIFMSKQAVTSLSTFQSALQQYKDVFKSNTALTHGKDQEDKIDKKITKQLPIFTDNQKQFILRNLEKPNKKKTISSSSSLSKFSFNLLSVSILFFGLIIALPIIQYVLIQNFQEESILNVRVLNSLYDLKNSFVYSYYLIIGVVYNSINNTTLYKGYFFAERVPTFFADNATKLSTVLSIITKSSATTRYDNSDYQNFFYQILKQDVCQPLSDYPQFADSEAFPIDLDLCKTIRGGILQSGYQTASKYFFDTLQSVYDITLSSSGATLKATLRAWEPTFDIPNFNKFFTMMINTLSILKEFMKTKGDNYLKQMQTTQYLISIFEIVILFFLFFIWWIFFYRRMQQEMNQNRRLLSLLDIQVVMENTYILAYLSKIKII